MPTLVSWLSMTKAPELRVLEVSVPCTSTVSVESLAPLFLEGLAARPQKVDLSDLVLGRADPEFVTDRVPIKLLKKGALRQELIRATRDPTRNHRGIHESGSSRKSSSNDFTPRRGNTLCLLTSTRIAMVTSA